MHVFLFLTFAMSTTSAAVKNIGAAGAITITITMKALQEPIIPAR